MKALMTTAPATAAVRDYPVHELAEARVKMEQWSEQVRLMQELLQYPTLSEVDRMTVCLELATAKTCLLACANIIARCEERMREQAARLEERWGWLL